MNVSVHFDPKNDVLYLMKKGAVSTTSTEARHDGHLVINLDAANKPVGVQYIGAGTIPKNLWAKHPDRDQLDETLLEAIDRWIETR